MVASHFKNLLYIVNDLDFFVSHRMELGTEAIKRGANVSVAYGTASTAALDKLRHYGIQTKKITIKRSTFNPLMEVISFFEVFLLLIFKKPDLLHLVTIKPYLYGGVAARLTRVPAVVSAVSGLGTIFISKTRLKSLLLLLLKPIFQFAMNHPNQIIIFQNTSDKDLLIKWGVVRERNTMLIRGSGVDLSVFRHSVEPEGVPIVTFAARLLKDKGIEDFIDAARILKKKCIAANFWIVGKIDQGNLSSISPIKIDEWKSENYLKFLGQQEDISKIYSQSHIICLPSYREGLPKSLIEGAASGRAIVTTNVPGCRDAIIPGKTGLLVPPQNPNLLAQALEELILDPEKRSHMGKEGRKLACRAFSINKVVNEHFQIYNKLANQC